MQREGVSRLGRWILGGAVLGIAIGFLVPETPGWIGRAEAEHRIA